MKKLDQTVIFFLLSIAIGYPQEKQQQQQQNLQIRKQVFLKTKKKNKLGRFCLIACLLLLPSLLASFLSLFQGASMN